MPERELAIVGSPELAGAMDVSRVEMALRRLGAAADRIHRLEAETDQAFPEYIAARAEAQEFGVAADLEMTPPFAAAFAKHKQVAAEKEGRTVSREDAADHGWTLREDEAG